MGSRRDFIRLALAASLGHLSAAAQPVAEVDPFQLGVASGMPTADGVVLWTRLLPRNLLRNPWADQVLDVRWELAEDEAFSRGLRSGTVQALPQLAHSVHVELNGLAPGRPYFYRFLFGGAVSPLGRTRTLPAADEAVRSLRLGFASCQRLANGPFGAYRRMLEENLDLIAFVGDYIYDSGSWPTATLPRGLEPARSLAGYREHYELHKRDPALQAAHAALPWLLTWDDHEVINDYAGGPARGLSGERVASLRRAAYQAYYEHMPLRLSSLVRGLGGLIDGGEELRLYGRAPWGRLAALHLLDTRQYRDAQVCSGTGGYVPADCAALEAPQRSLLGAEQEAWLDAALQQQRRGQGQAWNLILQTTLVSPRRVPVFGSQRVFNDGWDGYPAARERLLGRIAASEVAGPVFLGGDLHENWACNVPAGLKGEAARRTVASEFSGTGITMSSFFPKKTPEIREANPHAVYADGSACGYGVVALSPGQLRMEFKRVDSIAKDEPEIRLDAAFVVEAGDPRLQRA